MVAAADLLSGVVEYLPVHRIYGLDLSRFFLK
jgi:hypothetical protein